MKNDGENIDYDRLTAYIAGEGLAEERQAMQDWIDASEDNRRIYEQHKKIFLLDYDVDHAVTPDDRKEVFFNTDDAWKKVAGKTGLGTADDKTIELPAEPAGGTAPGGRPVRWLGIAASVLIGLALWFYFANQQGNQVTVSFEQGINAYYLPDSTRIVTSGATRLVFDKNFNHNHRTLKMKGKAYFDVVRNTELPFIIDTEYARVSVLGTAFSVVESKDNLTVEVERGKVSLASQQSEEEARILLKQNEKGILDIEKNTLRKTKLSDLNHLYWANRKLTYRQAPLQEVLNNLATLFEKKILYDAGAIAGCRVSAVFNDQKFEDILENISVVMDFDYVITENQIEIISGGCDAN